MIKKLVLIIAITTLASCANPAYIKKSAKIYPHKNPQEQPSEGTYLNKKSKPNLKQNNNSTNNSINNSLTLKNSSKDWQKADNGAVYKIGNPYKINGRWYRPKEYESFSQTGVASWYGPQFHLKKTANGGIFDKNIPSAAHKTLPLPSVVQVTNLNNKKSIIVKVIDRGPYSKSRIIDLSEKAAEMLEFKDKGTTNVRITLILEESKKLKKLMSK